MYKCKKGTFNLNKGDNTDRLITNTILWKYKTRSVQGSQHREVVNENHKLGRGEKIRLSSDTTIQIGTVCSKNRDYSEFQLESQYPLLREKGSSI